MFAFKFDREVSNHWPSWKVKAKLGLAVIVWVTWTFVWRKVVCGSLNSVWLVIISVESVFFFGLRAEHLTNLFFCFDLDQHSSYEFLDFASRLLVWQNFCWISFWLFFTHILLRTNKFHLLDNTFNFIVLAIMQCTSLLFNFFLSEMNHLLLHILHDVFWIWCYFFGLGAKWLDFHGRPKGFCDTDGFSWYWVGVWSHLRLV